MGIAVISSAREMLIIAGPRMTTKIEGKMQNTSGNSIFTGAFCAFSCALSRRLMRISSACERRRREMETPKVSAWSMARMKLRSSGTSLRSAMARSASARVDPIRISCSMRRNSSDSAPGTAVHVRSRACSKPRPASTEITRRSRMSGSLREICFWRSSIFRLTSTSGYMNDAPHSTITPTNRSMPLKCRNNRTGSQTTTDTRPRSFITRILSTLRFGGFPAWTSFCAIFSP